ncbi:MAG: NFACT family protein [Clostridium sp.]|jgi:predicted ribosome quality control (RQC) complex YloA/Tae2 family protein|nr:NFACT family protein [Clostridium sp.]
MAFDGVTIANVVQELRSCLLGGRLSKIAQPENDELLLTIKTASGQKRLSISASASLPLLYLTEANKPSPMTAPNFCMLLRKHLQNGRITDIYQPDLERIVCLVVEHLDELGDVRRKKLIVELMGKHSNIIFCNEEDQIIDSIKHVSGLVSSLREVLPGKPYFLPQALRKKNPLDTDFPEFRALLTAEPVPVFQALYSCYTGISPVLAQELCYEAGVDAEVAARALAPAQDTVSAKDTDVSALSRLYRAFERLMDTVRTGSFTPTVAYTGFRPQPLQPAVWKPAEFAAVPLAMYASAQDRTATFPSMSALLETYYAEKNALARIRQKSADLRRVVCSALERGTRKYDLQLLQMKDTLKRDTYRVYGELLNAYGYSVPPGSRSLEALNYHTNETVTIPLDPTRSPGENAQRYFQKYRKMKRTYEALTQLTQEVLAEIRHLESIGNALDIATAEEDLVPIQEELTESGYLRRKAASRKHRAASRPFHYLSSDGYDIYVGKNNYQNDELTFHFASGNDWWFHAKGLPGSHVVLKTKPEQEIPDRAYEEAGRLAAYYSRGREQEKTQIDYVQRKHVKKPGGAKPGFVVYYTNYSLVIDSDISGIRQIR